MKELKPCPFCGGIPEREKLTGGVTSCETNRTPSYSIYCTYCYVGLMRYKRKCDATKAWNKRAQ